MGEGRTLSAVQEQAVRQLIADELPGQLQLPFALWTRNAVAQLLETKPGLKLPVRTMGEYLKRWGFTPQKPIKKAYEQNPGQVQRWLKGEYPAIAAQAQAEGAESYWGDQTGVNNQPNAPRGYAPQRSDPDRKPALEVLWVFGDERGDQPGQCAVAGLPRGAECRAAHPFHGAVGAPDEGPQGVSDLRQPARASQCASQGVAGNAPGTDRGVSSAHPTDPVARPDSQPSRMNLRTPAGSGDFEDGVCLRLPNERIIRVACGGSGSVGATRFLGRKWQENDRRAH